MQGPHRSHTGSSGEYRVRTTVGSLWGALPQPGPVDSRVCARSIRTVSPSSSPRVFQGAKSPSVPDRSVGPVQARVWVYMRPPLVCPPSWPVESSINRSNQSIEAIEAIKPIESIDPINHQQKIVLLLLDLLLAAFL